MAGLGTVYKKTRSLKNGGTRTFYVSQIRMVIDGQYRRIEGQGKTKQDAIDARQRAVARALAGTTRHPAHTAREGTLEAEMTRWNEERDVRPRSREHVQSIIKNHIAPEEIGSKTLRTLRSTDIERLIETRETDWVRLDVYKTLRAFMTYAVRTNRVRSDPMSGITRPHMPRARLATPVAMETAVSRLTAMLRWMRSTGWTQRHPMYWARIMLALEGLRPGEARGLQWSDVEHLERGGDPPRIIVRTQLGYAEGTLQLTTVKGSIPRIIMLRGQTAEALRAWKRVREELQQLPAWHPRPGFEELVLAYDNGRPLRQQDDSREWRAVLEEAQKENEEIALWPTSYMRHVAVSLMRDAGVAASLVAAMMGHSVEVEDRVYYQSQPAAQARAAERMDRMLEERTRPEDAPDFAEKLLSSLKGHPASKAKPLHWEDIRPQSRSEG